MHKGKVREMGAISSFLAQRGIYWKLYQLQYKDQEISAIALPSTEPSGVTVSGDDEQAGRYRSIRLESSTIRRLMSRN